MAVTRGPTTRRVAYTYDPETGNYSYGLQHPMKVSPCRARARADRGTMPSEAWNTPAISRAGEAKPRRAGS